MKTMTTLAATLALFALALPVGAQAGLELLSSEAAVEQLYGYKGEDGKQTDPALATRYLARAQAAMQVTGDLSQAQVGLELAWKMATAIDGFEGQEELLVQVALARVQLYQSLGDLVRARQAADRLLLIEADIQRLGLGPNSLAPATARLMKLAMQAKQDARLVKLRERLKASSSDASDSLEFMVREAYQSGSYSFIEAIGVPAQSIFALSIVADADQFAEAFTEDPLYYLLQINEQQAAKLFLANMNAGGYLWKRRIMRAMKQLNVLNNEGTWSSTSPYMCLEPEWLNVLEALLSSPDTAIQSVHLIEEPFFRDQLTPGLQQALVHGIENYPHEFVNAVLQAIDHGGVVESVRPILGALARHADPDVRNFAAGALSNFEESAILQSMAGDPDPRVRARVVRALGRHSVSEIRRLRQARAGRATWVTDTNSRMFTPLLGDAARDLLKQLSKDSVEAVRSSAAYAIARLIPPLEDEVYVRLAADEFASVRAKLVHAHTVRPDLYGALLAQLALDQDPSVLESVDYVLDEAPLDSNPGPYLKALRARLTSLQSPMVLERSRALDLVKSSEGLVAFASWLEASRDPTLRTEFFLMNDAAGYRHLLALGDESLSRVFVLAQAEAEHLSRRVASVIRNARPSRGEAMRLVLLDEGDNLAVRLDAAYMAAQDGGQVFHQGLLALLASESWKRSPASSDDLKLISRIIELLPSSEQNPVRLDIVRNRDIAGAVAQAALKTYSTIAPLGREITLAVMERWFIPKAPLIPAVENAVAHLGALPSDATPELMRSIASNPSYTRVAIHAMNSLHRVEDLSTLELCMDAPWEVNYVNRERMQEHAARTVASYLSEQAADILLRGLASPNPAVRATCADGLESMEDARSRQGRWQTQAQEKPTKESALEELVEMLGNENLEIRLQAIRGIATFGAVEYLPALIRLLADPEAKIVEAARTAIFALSQADK